MPDTIGVKMKVDGETSFNKAMRDAAKNTKALDAELKLAQAQFKQSGDAEKLMADRGKILNEQLGEQEKAVKTAKDMLAQLAKAGYEQNSTKVLEWRKKLAQAEQSVLEINSAIDNNAKGLDAAGKKYDSLGESMQSVAMDAETAKANLSSVDGMASSLYGSLSTIGSELGWEGLSKGIQGINATIDKAVQKVAELSKKIWEAGVDATIWADDLATAAQIYDIDTETLQRWQYASRFVDTSVETIVKAREKLNQSMGSTSKETALAFNELHVATRDASGNLRNDTDVFWDVITALGAVENASQRDILAQKVLGKSYAELAPLVKAGREEWDKYADSAPIVTEEKVDKLTAANDAIENMNAQLETLKLDVLSALSPTIEAVAVAIGDAAQKMREFVDSEEGQAAITALSESVTSLITDFTEQDFGTVLKTAAENVASFVQSLADLLKDKDRVINALEGIAIAIGALKLAEAAINAGKLLASLRLLTGFKLPSVPATPTATTAGAGAGSVVTSTLGASIAKIVGGVGAGAYTYLQPLLEQFANAKQREDAAKEIAEADDAVANAATEFGHTLEEAESYIAGNMHEWGVDAETAKAMYVANGDGFDAPALPPAMAEEVDTTKAKEVIELTEAQAEAAQKYWDIVRNGATPDQEAFAYQDLFDAFADDQAWEKLDSLLEFMDSIPKTMEDLPTESEASGENIVIGMANGINKKASVAVTAALNLANAVSGTIAQAMMIASPSKLMEQYGEYIGEGLANGISDTQSLVAGASRSMLGGISLATPSVGATRYGASGESVPGLILSALSNMKVMIDGKEAGAIMLPAIEDLMAEQIGSRRYT